MPRPGPRPYECIRRAWHSDGHQPLRGTITQEILRVVTELHKPETRRKREWQEKLPVVVLRAEEILYSKARSEENYVDLNTLRERLEDAVDTMIRRTDSSKDGPFMQPCVEAALSLGCSKKNPKGLRLGGARYSAEALKRYVVPACASAAAYVDAALPRNLNGLHHGNIAQDLYKACDNVHAKNLGSLWTAKQPDIASKRSHPIPSTSSLPHNLPTASLQVKPLGSFTRINPGVQLNKSFPTCHGHETPPLKVHPAANYVLQSPLKGAHISEMEYAIPPALKSVCNSSSNQFTDANLIVACRSGIAALRLDLNSHSSGLGHGEVDELQLRLAPPGNFVSKSETDEGLASTESCITSLCTQQASAVCCAKPLANFVASSGNKLAADNIVGESSGSRGQLLFFDEFCVSPKTIAAPSIDINSSLPKKPRWTVHL